jgi:hypothetical protein
VRSTSSPFAGAGDDRPPGITTMAALVTHCHGQSARTG